MTDKREARKAARAKLESLDPEYLNRSNRVIMKNAIHVQEYQAARAVFCYYSVGREAGTAGIIRHSLAAGKTVALPVIDGRDMWFAVIESLDGPLESGALGIPQPSKEAKRIEPQEGDVIFVPALSCDEDHYRLGHGGGYYDRFLADCPAVSVGLCYEELLTARLPREDHDVPVTYLITENSTSVMLKF